MEYDAIVKMKNDIENLKNGIDPKSKITITQDTILLSSYNNDLLNSVYIFLTEYIKKSYNSTKLKTKKERFNIKKEEIKLYTYSESPISISEFTFKINNCISSKDIKRLKATEITLWLTKNNYLEDMDTESGRVIKITTPKGISIGINRVEKINKFGNRYSVNVYNISAQRFLINNLNEMIL